MGPARGQLARVSSRCHRERSAVRGVHAAERAAARGEQSDWGHASRPDQSYERETSSATDGVSGPTGSSACEWMLPRRPFRSAAAPMSAYVSVQLTYDGRPYATAVSLSVRSPLEWALFPSLLSCMSVASRRALLPKRGCWQQPPRYRSRRYRTVTWRRLYARPHPRALQCGCGGHDC